MKRHSRHPTSNPTLQALAEVGVFSHCSSHQLEFMLANTDVLRFTAGTVLARAGGRPQQFLGLIDGYVEAIDAQGNAVVLGPGDQIGGRELIDDGRLSATFTTLTPANLVVVFSPVFRWAANRFPEVSAALAQLAQPVASSVSSPVEQPVSFVS